MDTWVWHQVGLEFGDIDVKGTIESEGSSKSRDSGNFQLSITDTESGTWDEHEVEREHGEVETQEILSLIHI